MRFLPHTEAEIRFMLDVIGAASIDELFEPIPPPLRLDAPPEIGPPLSEQEVLQELAELSSATASEDTYSSFLGGGVYRHYSPSVVNHILLRSEFYTAYTPYQAEISQGTLQTIFEFQTMICDLLGVDVANASLYDGASGLAEALLMAERVTRRGRFLLARNLHPQYRAVARTIMRPRGLRVDEVPYDPSGVIDAGALEEIMGDDIAAVAVQSPNYFGGIEDMAAAAETAHRSGALLIGVVTEPLALALLEPPGRAGADIVVGEGQSLGVPPSFGGPGLGLFGTKGEYIRQMPGRLVSQARDTKGRTGYVLTLSTREQHIRREKARSNICTNHHLLALAATVYLTAMGKQGLARLARLNLSRAEFAKETLASIEGVRHVFGAPTFNEFVIETPRRGSDAVAKLAKEKILPGIPIGIDYPEMPNALLMSVTETNTRDDIVRLAQEISKLK